ncbi:MAG: DUF3466 family protein [Planctomycetota bacterium]|jgi:probable HAF family extracellular repeat protein
MRKSILLFTLSICVITAGSQAVIFSDGFESGTLDQWTIGGPQLGRESIAEVVDLNSNPRAHLYQDGVGAIYIAKTFSYQNELNFSFDMEAQTYSEAPGSDSTWYAASGVLFDFLDSSSNRLGSVFLGSMTSTWPIEQNEVVSDRHSIPVSGDLSSYSVDVEDILSNIIIDMNELTHVNLEFFSYTSSNDYNMNGHCWTDNVVVTLEPGTVSTYTITDLGTLGGTSSRAYGINESGQIVGKSDITGDSVSHAFLYDGIKMHDLGTLGGPSSNAISLNDNAEVVGHSRITGDSSSHAFYYDGTTMHDLGTLGGSWSEALGINNSGVIVGYSDITGDSARHAFYYDGTMHDLSTLGGSASEALNINESGHIVGYSDITGDSAHHAFYYDGTIMHDLETLGGTNSYAFGINESGQIVGESDITGDSASNAFYYDGTMHDLGTLGGTSSIAFRINEQGQAVGESDIIGDSVLHAFLYDGNGLIDLNDLIPIDSGWELTVAVDINNSGQIVGWGMIDGQEHAFLMTPVSETPVTPSEQIAFILDFIDASVADSSLTGEGPDKSGGNRLRTFIKMVENVQKHINKENYTPAGNKIDVVLKRCSEGSSGFVAGEAVEELREMLLKLKADLNG